VHLLNVDGKEISIIKEGKSIGEIPLEINVKDLSSGIYFVILKINGKQYYNKFVVNK
jgi:hypothetical protein